jgi:hypothetical protein
MRSLRPFNLVWNMPRFDVVVSAENNTYLVWQAMLFHYSCVTHLGQAPIVVVHTSGEPLLPGFRRIVEAGGIVQTAPNYRPWAGINYPPRNTPGALRHVTSDADYLLLCDADMIFLRPFPWDECRLTDRQVSVDFIGYLDPDGAEHQPVVDEVCRRAGVEPRRLRECPMNGGVPHVIPRTLQKRLSDDWLECIELFPVIEPWPAEVARTPSRHCHLGPQKPWLTSMWALVLSVHRLGLAPVVTQWCITNHRGADALPAAGAWSPAMIHYCYGDAGFDKRQFDGQDAAERRVWQAPPADDTISGAIRRQVREAAVHYGFAPLP